MSNVFFSTALLHVLCTESNLDVVGEKRPCLLDYNRLT